jgi:hypothetical protein
LSHPASNDFEAVVKPPYERSDLANWRQRPPVKYLKYGVVDQRALAHSVVGQPVNGLEQHKTDHEAGATRREALVAERRNLAVDRAKLRLPMWLRPSSRTKMLAWKYWGRTSMVRCQRLPGLPRQGRCNPPADMVDVRPDASLAARSCVGR